MYNVTNFPRYTEMLSEIYEELSYARAMRDMRRVNELNRKIQNLVKSAVAVDVSVSSINRYIRTLEQGLEG